MTWTYIAIAVAFVLGAVSAGLCVGVLLLHIVRNWQCEVLIADGKATINPRFNLWPEE